MYICFPTPYLTDCYGPAIVRMTRFSSFLFHITLGIASLACGGGRADNSARLASRTVFGVALLTPRPISDQSVKTGAYSGLVQIKDSLGASVSHIQTKTPGEFDENFRQSGAAGCALAFGHGFEFQHAAARVAPEYPNTIYITTGGERTGANVAAMAFAFDEPTFLAGMVAASVSRSGTVGCIGGTELPPVKSSFAAFTEGVHAVSPTAHVLVSYIGNWDDAGAGKEQALAQIGHGVDIIFQNADAAGLGIFQAVKENGHAWVIGSNSNQNSVAPTVTLGSVVIDLPHAFVTIARAVKVPAFTARVIHFDTKSTVVRWMPNPSLASIIPATAQHQVDSVHSLMVARTFKLPRAGDVP